MSWRPPRAEPLSIDGPAGPLEALLEDPQTAAAAGFAVLCHPHPLHGGTMHNKVVHTVARACQERGMPTLRFNYRGVGSSAGSYDDGRGETQDALAVIAAGRARWPAAALTLAGFSFGGAVSLRAAQWAAPAHLISIAPAVMQAEFAAIARPAGLWLIVQGEADDIVKCSDVRAFAARFQPPPQLVVLAGAGHFFHRRLPELRDAAFEFLSGPHAAAGAPARK